MTEMGWLKTKWKTENNKAENDEWGITKTENEKWTKKMKNKERKQKKKYKVNKEW
jgi:hypothetical protein